MLKNIIFNTNFEIIDQMGIFELIGIILIILSILIAYYSYIDKGKTETVSVFKVLKYFIIYFYNFIAFMFIACSSFRQLDNGSSFDCLIVNTIKLSIYLAIFALMIFLVLDQLTQFFKERYYKYLNIL